MLNDALEGLSKELSNVAEPNGQSAWIYLNSWNKLATKPGLDKFLSGVCENVYPYTPVIRSEVAVRKKTSGTITNSRKKLLLALLTASGRSVLE